MKTQQKLTALKLKLEGHSVSYIAKALNVSKSTAHAALQNFHFEISWLLETVEQLKNQDEQLFKVKRSLILLIIRKINGFLSHIGRQRMDEHKLQELIDEALDVFSHIMDIQKTTDSRCDDLEGQLKQYLTLLQLEHERARERGYDIYPESLKKLQPLKVKEVQAWEK